MRPLNPNERKLLLFFGGSIFFVLNILAAQWFLGQTRNIQTRLSALESSASGYKAVLQERPRWESRQAWLAARPMDSYQGSTTDSRFAEEVQRSLVQDGLSIEAQQLHEAATQGDIVEVSLDLTVKGQLEQIIRWMQEVQQPGKYFVIRSFTLKRFDDGPTMSARMAVCRLFRQASLASSP